MTHHTYGSMIHFAKGKRYKSVLIAAFVVVTIFCCSTRPCKAEDDGDLDDHISKYKDDPIAKLDELGDDSVNINFIIVEALGRIKRTGRDQYINSVVIGPGSNVGDIYNIHLNEPGDPVKPDNRKKNDSNNSKD